MEERNENLSYKSMKRYTTYPDESVADDPDNANLVLDNIDYLKDSLNSDNAGAHNSVFRGKNITKYFDDGSLWTKISSGTFEDLFVGDYIVKNGITWRIAGFDYYLNKGDTPLRVHHAVIVPDSNLATDKMEEENDTTGGYLNSYMVTTVLPKVLTTIEGIFGKDHVLEYRSLLTNSINNTAYNRLGKNTGASSGYAFSNRKVDLLGEIQLYGSVVWSSSGYDSGIMNTQLPLFLLEPKYITNGTWYYVRDVASSTSFVTIGIPGHSYAESYANLAIGVRPFFFIG